MSTSLLHGSKLASVEAASICGTVEANLDVIRTIALGRKFRLDSTSFTLLKRDRNILYRLDSGGVWFLKMPAHRKGDAIRREATGARAVADSLLGHPGYCAPCALSVSEEHDYLLTARVVGQTLNTFFYRAAAQLKRNPRLQVRNTFGRVGSALAKLHRASGNPLAARTNRPIDQLVVSWPAEGCAPDLLAEAAIATTRQRISPRDSDSLIHGNMRMDNVIASDTAVTFVDFENCGMGSAYEDLSVLCSQLVLTQTLVWFPMRSSREAVSALLDGYCGTMPCDLQTLQAYVGARLTDYYLGFLAGRGGRMAGIPVVASKLKRVVSEVAGSELSLIVEGSICGGDA